ncbi:4047_t:CDS:2, partial [Funneliformis mosseae]
GSHLYTYLAIINRELVAKFNILYILLQSDDSNSNHELLVANLHILNQLRAPDTFTANVKQHVVKPNLLIWLMNSSIRRRLPYKCIKSALENAYHSTKTSVLNLPDSNLQSLSRIPLHTYDITNHG